MAQQFIARALRSIADLAEKRHAKVKDKALEVLGAQPPRF